MERVGLLSRRSHVDGKESSLCCPFNPARRIELIQRKEEGTSEKKKTTTKHAVKHRKEREKEKFSFSYCVKLGRRGPYVPFIVNTRKLSSLTEFPEFPLPRFLPRANCACALSRKFKEKESLAATPIFF